jgi:hypothetical protein
MGTTLTWGGVSLASTAGSTEAIRINQIQRPIRKPVTRHKVEIPGRKGSWDFGGGVERDYSIVMNMTIVASNAANLQTAVKKIDTFFDGKKALIFSDDTGTIHTAQIYEMCLVTPVGLGNVARATINFECDSSTST